MAVERELSPQAQARMAEMLPELVGAVRGRRRRRRAAQSVAAVAAVWLAVALWPQASPAPRDSIAGGGAASSAICEVVGDVPGVLERYRARPDAGGQLERYLASPASGALARYRAQPDVAAVVARCVVDAEVRPEWFVDDGGLRRFLADAGRASGLVRVGERVTVDPSAIDPRPGRGAD